MSRQRTIKESMMKITANNGKTYTLPKNPKWRKGAPPSIGWWPASIQGLITSIRWWDGQHWSAPCGPSYGPRTAARSAKRKEINATADIEWTDRWWEKKPDRQALQAAGIHPAPCARHCEANAFEIAARGMRKQITELQAELESVRKQAAPALPLTDEMILSCPFENDGMRMAFFRGWVKAEAAHGITKGGAA